MLARAALMEAVENATALVLVKGRDGVSMGSGFFISDSLLVTNGHVVEDLKGPGVSLVSRALGTMRRGTVMARAYAPGTRDVFDFALIRLDDGVAPGRLPLALRIGKLDDVVAAGYPGVVVRADESFKRLVAGDASSAPDLNFTTGAVQSIQRQGDSVEQIAHTAAIYRGNSGGPLVDKCGRVVGVNTFGLKTENAPGATTIDFAQGSSMLVKFLQRASQSLDADIRPCGS